MCVTSAQSNLNLFVYAAVVMHTTYQFEFILSPTIKGDVETLCQQR
ncbi:hypothetical protein VIBNISO65_670015 [Vibrio nigripulchritudo SO65]|nr:hypothetical protein VIBNISO65_670015 [Vibrio nigripulchritudo SO65]